MPDPATTTTTTATAVTTGRPDLLRYARLLAVQVRMSALSTMQYRVELVVRGAISIFWTAVTLVPVFIVFGERSDVAGWSFPESLVVVAWFMVLRGVLEGAVSPSLTAVVEHVRKGTLDFVLLKPADAQFLVSTAKFELWRVIDVAGALALFAYAFAQLGHAPSPGQLAAGLGFFLVAVLLLYSIWILVVSAAFWVVKVDNLSYLFGSVLDFARWPVTFFRGALRFVFTFVFPLAVMTTYPAQALLGKLTGRTALGALVGALAFAAVARAVWRRALAMYTSASS